MSAGLRHPRRSTPRRRPSGAHRHALPAGAGALCALALLLCAAPAAAQQLEVGALVGPNYNMLDQPTDPPGAPTVMHGSGFTGFGVGGGLTAHLTYLELGSVRLGAELDVLLTHHSATGFERYEPADQYREITLRTQMLRVPLLATARLVGERWEGRVALGPELLWGLDSTSAVYEENLGAVAEPFPNTAVTHLGIDAVVGAAYRIGRVSIPLELRFVFDPFVGDSSRERLRGYESPENIGRFEVAFDRQILLMIGLTYTL